MDYACVRGRPTATRSPLPPGTLIEARLQADYVELWHQGKRVVRHERCYSASSRYSISNTTSMCCVRSLEHWPVQHRWPSGDWRVDGPIRLIAYGRH